MENRVNHVEPSRPWPRGESKIVETPQSMLLVSPAGNFIYWSLTQEGRGQVEEGECEHFEYIRELQDQFKPDRVVVTTDMRTQEAMEAAHRFGWETSSSATVASKGLTAPICQEPPRHGHRLIAQERIRQVTEKKHSPEGDDACEDQELAIEAIRWVGEGTRYSTTTWGLCGSVDHRRSKPRIRQLVIAGALIAAEIDRLLRSHASTEKTMSAGTARRE